MCTNVSTVDMLTFVVWSFIYDLFFIVYCLLYYFSRSSFFCFIPFSPLLITHFFHTLFFPSRHLPFHTLVFPFLSLTLLIPFSSHFITLFYNRFWPHFFVPIGRLTLFMHFSRRDPQCWMLTSQRNGWHKIS